MSVGMVCFELPRVFVVVVLRNVLSAPVVVRTSVVILVKLCVPDLRG